MVRVTMEFQVPNRHIFRPTLSTDMVQQILWWERQKRCMIEKCCYNRFLMIFYFYFLEEEKM